jgi:hypothetical protein
MDENMADGEVENLEEEEEDQDHVVHFGASGV